MNVTSACPTPEQLSGLIRGSLSVDDNIRFTDHIETCVTCQGALQADATGELPIDDLVSGVKKWNPGKESNYWHAMARIEQEHPSGIHENRTTDPSANGELAQTKDPAGELDFLDPSDDPAYLGKLHHFQIARVIGRGGMGIVVEAFDPHLHRSVAIKVLNPQYQANDVARQRFCREGRAAAAISHEHVVPMYHVAKAHEGEVAYLVMQLIEGDTLERRLSDRSPLPPNDVARISMQIAAGLSAAHKREMVHRDIKPANIMIEAETGRVKLTDFGLARATDDVKLTKTGMVTGTPLYMSPEQTLGETANEQSDLFSLGAVMYEMATGVAPFQAPSALGVMQNIMHLTPEAPHKLNAAIPRPLSDLILSLLAKKPEDRPESASAVATALASIVNGYGPISPLQVPSVAAKEVKKLSGSYRRLERRWVMAAWGAAAFGLVCLLTAGFVMSRTDTGDDFPSVILPDNPGTVWSVDFAPDGERLAAAIEDGSVRIWDIGNQQLLKSFNAHRGIVWMVAYHPTRPLLMTSGDDSSIKLWDSDHYELVSEWKADNAVRSVAFSPDGHRVVAGDVEGTIHVYDIDTGEQLARKNQPGSILGIDYSSDGKLIASVGSDKVVRVFDAETLDERNTLAGHDGPIYSVKFAPDGPLLASVGWNKNVRVWNTETGAEVMNLVGSEGDIWGVSFCGDGTHLVTGEQGGAARVWDLSNGDAITTLRGHASAVHNVSLDPTAHRIATSSRDGTVRVWDMSCVVPK
ncbi:WD40 repeat domain-containing serine/threonine protein kinase [Allorhodopirellula heiligendammensis]|uniref:non-specific serine/threonine protein kinase n=1 Tax=Allorhodopirellula heiligendammensis TaxID=2714739 RepID=A0A5C6C3D6_9BACT|nr:serine/threonine-protein kinase [Allorhodopirellula heiligendammensis]TWU18131.1 Serine/threonine-protein kinase PrkC [Allorhodopirellula heiligendammensis]